MTASKSPLHRVAQEWGLSQASTDRLVQLALPCVYLALTPPGPLHTGESRFGGGPDVTSSFDWPLGQSYPLTFLVQVRLQDLPPGDWGLPSQGLLQVFYDDRGGEAGPDSLARVESNGALQFHPQLNDQRYPGFYERRFPPRRLQLNGGLSLPRELPEASRHIGSELGDYASFRYDVQDAYAESSKYHQLRGWPGAELPRGLMADSALLLQINHVADSITLFGDSVSTSSQLTAYYSTT